MPEKDDQVENVIPMCDLGEMTVSKARTVAKEAIERWRAAQLINEKPKPKHSIRTADEVLGVSEHNPRYFIEHAGANSPSSWPMRSSRLLNWLKRWSDKL